MIRYAHTNLVATDWKRLAQFYQDVLECTPVPPERDYDASISSTIGKQVTALQGIHLRLPGHGPSGPTLEIFQYTPSDTALQIQATTPGFSHIAFAVDDVRAIAAKVIQHGGAAVGEYTEMSIPGAGIIQMQYVSDPEGNIVELQNWPQTRQ